MSDDILKICTQCKLEKPLTDYHNCKKNAQYGKKQNCKLCIKEKANKYHIKKSKDISFINKRKENCRKYREERLKNNPNYWKNEYSKYREVCKERSLIYYKQNSIILRDKFKKRRLKNIDIYKEISNRWKEKNKDRMRLKHKLWLLNNKEKVLLYNRKRRALKNNVTIVKFSNEQLEQRMSIFGFACAYCKGPFEHVDHVIPLSKGGLHCLGNLRPSCAFCNMSKHNKSLKEFLNKKGMK